MSTINRMAVLFTLLASPVAAAPAQPPVAAPAGPTDGTVLIGVLTRQFTPGCDHGQDVWREPSHYEIGFVKVLLPAALDPGPLIGKLVVARGRTVDQNVSAHHRFD